MSLCFLVQVYILINNSSLKDKLNIFNLNAPPILGVVGTIYAFSIFLSYDANQAEMVLLFKQNFNQAALTTILGGMTYVLNLAIYIFITENDINE
jgi:hypothetical protein